MGAGRALCAVFWAAPVTPRTSVLSRRLLWREGWEGSLPLVPTEGRDGSPWPPAGVSCQQAFQNAQCSVWGPGRSEGQRGEEGSLGVPHRGTGYFWVERCFENICGGGTGGSAVGMHPVFFAAGGLQGLNF